jgi:hypothetical protein
MVTEVYYNFHQRALSGLNISDDKRGYYFGNCILSGVFYFIFSNTPFRKQTLSWRLLGEESRKKVIFLQIRPGVKHGRRQYTASRVALQLWGL